MVDPVLITVVPIVLAVLFAVLGLSVDIPYVEYGLPMLVLLLGSGIYTFQAEGLSGILSKYNTGIFIGTISSFLTFLIVQGEKFKSD
jgi:hypothetical protein